MTYLNKSDFSLVHDLNRFQDLGHAQQISSAGDRHALGSTRSQACPAQSQRFLLSRSVLGAVFCSADRPRFFARFRVQFACAAPTFPSLGFSLQDDLAQHHGQLEPRSAMVSLCGFGASFDRRGSPTLRQRCNERRAQIVDGRHRLRIGCDHHRSVSESVFLGAVSHDKSRHQTSHLDGSAWIDPKFYSHQRRQDARCQSPRHPRKARLHRGWRLLRDGRGLCRLCQAAPTAYRKSLICDPRQKQYAIRCGSGISCPLWYGLCKRSAHSVDGIQLVLPISRTDSTSDLHRSRNRQDARVSDQQHDASCVDNLCTLQTALASRVVFQVDQTAPAYQGILWHNRKRSQDANMDCHRHLSVDRYRQKAFELGSFFVRNSASAGPEYV
jgi:hypothetical protein